MVGLVIVSHSAALAAGVVELARQMGAGQVPIEAAGGMADGEIGTDVGLVQEAIEKVASPDGVLVLMDLGSAVMSAEMAAEMVAMSGDTEVVLSEAPLVEGAVAAAARAGAGAPLDEVAAEARNALGVKAAQLGIEPAAPAAPAPVAAGDGPSATLDVTNELGLHARPAARVVETAGRFAARVTLTDETTGKSADARSLSAVVMLGTRRGHTLRVIAEGEDADDALEAFRGLAADGFGDGPGPRGAATGRGSGTGAAAPGPPGARTAGASGSGAAAPWAETGGAGAAPAAEVPAAGALLQGVPVAPGIAIGPARLAAAALPEIDPDEVGGGADMEATRLTAAREAARADVRDARAAVAARAGEAEAAIFDAHLLLLDDTALLDPARDAIARGRAAPVAWHDAVTAAAAGYRGLDDPYLRERAADVEDVGGRVLRHLLGIPQEGLPAEPGILVVDDLTPGDAAGLDAVLVQALALARGGATSHAAILARALGIPSVAGLGAGILGIADGTTLVLDGTAGTLEVAPDPQALAARERAAAAAAQRRDAARARAHEPATTTDGVTLEVAANIGSATDAAEAVVLGADGVGLLRTEFLFLDRADAPSEEEQRAVLAEIAEALAGRPLIVRTLDAGADKPLRYVEQAPEENPFLGVRGLRLGLARPELLRTQLRAILAVAADHPLKVMFPMVAVAGELRAARAMLEEERATLGAPPVDVGIMIEVPAAALAADRLAREVDFFSIGTNDLTQYTMAAERGNAELAPLLTGPLPPVLRLVGEVARAGDAHGAWTGVCGELAGDPAAAVLLAGLGVRELSMAAPLVPEVKEALRHVSLADAREAARAALEAEDAAGARQAAAALLPTPSGPGE